MSDRRVEEGKECERVGAVMVGIQLRNAAPMPSPDASIRGCGVRHPRLILSFRRQARQRSHIG
jgi:hypothetical protein